MGEGDIPHALLQINHKSNTNLDPRKIENGKEEKREKEESYLYCDLPMPASSTNKKTGRSKDLGHGLIWARRASPPGVTGLSRQD